MLHMANDLLLIEYQTKCKSEDGRLIKGLHFCPIKVIGGLTDKGQINSISISHWIKGVPRGDLPVKKNTKNYH